MGCGAANVDKARFCGRCGAELATLPADNPRLLQSAAAKSPGEEGIKFHCTACGQKLEAPREMAGNQVGCPTCRKMINIPILERTERKGSGGGGSAQEVPPCPGSGPVKKDGAPGRHTSGWLVLSSLGFAVCAGLLAVWLFLGENAGVKNYAYTTDGDNEIAYTTRKDLKGCTYITENIKDYVSIADDGKHYAFITAAGKVPITRFLGSHKQFKDYSYLACSEAVTITSYAGEGGEVIIPSKIEGLPVTCIGRDAFNGCDKLTGVVIPNCVTNIGDTAFFRCFRLTSITIPNSVTSMGTETFHDCARLTSVTIPDSVTKIERWAFYHCESLTSVTIPNSVTSIGAEAFGSCKSLTSVTIPNGVTSIQAFTLSHVDEPTDARGRPRGKADRGSIQ